MKILYVMPFKICANNWHLTGDTNMASKILKGLYKYPELIIDVVGNFTTENGVDISEDIIKTYGVNKCIDISSIATSKIYIKKGFDLLRDMNIFDSYDLINIHNSNPSIISKLVTYLPNNKVVFTLHAPPENMTFQYYHREQYLDFLNSSNKCLLCVSESHSKRCLDALGYYKDFPEGNPNIKSILNGIEVHDYVNNELMYDCGTIGRFSQSKSMYESINSVVEITKHTGGRGFVVGDTSNYEGVSEKEKEYYSSIVNLLKENPQIDWYKKLNSSDIEQLLSKTKCYISLSSIETFGLTVCEAIMQGTPSIGFDLNGIGEIIEEGVTGYKIPKGRLKQSERYKQIIELYKNCINLDRDKIRERAEERFNLDRVIEQYKDLFLMYR